MIEMFSGGSCAYLTVVIVVGVAALATAIVDVILAFNDEANDRLNYILHDKSDNKLYFIPLFWGMTLGHLFLGKKYNLVCDLPIDPMMSVGILAGVNIVLILVGLRFPLRTKYKSFVRLTLLITGIVYGHFFWSMHYVDPNPNGSDISDSEYCQQPGHHENH